MLPTGVDLCMPESHGVHILYCDVNKPLTGVSKHWLYIRVPSPVLRIHVGYLYCTAVSIWWLFVLYSSQYMVVICTVQQSVYGGYLYCTAVSTWWLFVLYSSQYIVVICTVQQAIHVGFLYLAVVNRVICTVAVRRSCLPKSLSLLRSYGTCYVVEKLG